MTGAISVMPSRCPKTKPSSRRSPTPTTIGYEYLKTLDIGYSFYTGPYTEKISALFDPR